MFASGLPIATAGLRDVRLLIVWLSWALLYATQQPSFAQELAVTPTSVPAERTVPADPISEVDATFFETEVRPLLIEHCLNCHGEEKQEGGLRLDSRDVLIAGGDSGAAILLDDLPESPLLKAIRHEDREMPPSGKLSDSQTQIFERWVTQGALWPKSAAEGGMALRSHAEISDSDRQYWAFRPLEPIDAPPTKTSSITSQWTEASGEAITDVDRFVLAKLSEVQLTFAPPADKNTLLRRVYLDLVGVPPTQAEIDNFLTDDRSDAYEQLVSRLLNDPRYGEKWARHWLDLVRYAESDGFNQDASRPTAYLYRDWLISALNADMPYDQFVLYQLAGDEVAPNNPQALAATGYLRHWIYEYNQRDARSQWSNILNDLTDVTGEVFFGLGIGCARCHDHKFDPLLQEDYFRLQASFATFLPRDDASFGTTEQLAETNRQLAEWEAATDELRAEIKRIEDPIRNAIRLDAYNKFPLDIRPILHKLDVDRDGFEQQIAYLADRQVQLEWDKIDFAKQLAGDEKERWEHLQAELKLADSLRPQPLPRIMAAGAVQGPPPITAIVSNQSAVSTILPATFAVFGAVTLLGSNEGDDRALSGRRTALAHWINSPNNALTHRVIVNRMWQELFGAGLVRNVNDFGRLSDPPSHPQLLDWLANWFIQDGKSMKRLHQMLVTSAVYRQSAVADTPTAIHGKEVDWENRLLWHYPARRLDAEQIRDSMLHAAGALDAKRNGPAESHDSFVRSVFTQVKRNNPHPFLVAFDVPDRSTSVGRRNRTTTVNQALVLNNSDWTIQMATQLAERLVEQSSSPEQHVRDAYQRLFTRPPTEQDLARAREFLELEVKTLASGESGKEVEWFKSDDYHVALVDLCHVLFNSSEFLYID